MSRIKKFFVSVAALIGLLATVLLLAASGAGGVMMALGDKAATGRPDVSFEHQSGDRRAKSKLLAVRVDGVIVGETPSGVQGALGMTTVSGYRVQDILEAAAKDPAIKGVLVQFSTPGGTVHGARAIYDAIRLYREATAAASPDGKTAKPIIAHIEGISASGGVLGMVSADEILAEPGSIVGSIGVTMGTLLHYDGPVSVEAGLLTGGVTTRNGITAYTLAEGKGKDFGNPYRKPTEEEIAVIQAGLRASYADFVTLVATARRMEPDLIRDTMGAHVFGAEQAKGFGLIDGMATRREAFARLAERARVTDGYEVVRPGKDKSGLLQALLAAVDGPDGTGAMAANVAQCRTLSLQVMAYHGDVTALCR